MKKIVLLSYIAVICISASAQKKIDLSLNLKKGETYYLNNKAKVTITQSMMGQEIPIDMTVVGKLVFKTNEVTADGFVMDVRYADISMIISANGSVMEMASNTTKTDTVSRIFSKLMKGLTTQSLTVKLSKKGRVTEVANAEKLLEAMFADFQGIDAQMKDQLKTQIGQGFSDKAMKSTIESVTAIFPDQPVKAGDSWKVKILNESSMTYTSDAQYTLAEVGSSQYKIKGASTLTSDPNIYTKNNGLEIAMDLAGTATSDLMIDKTSSWIASGNIQQTLKGQSKIKDGPGMPGGMNIPMTMVSSSEISGKL